MRISGVKKQGSKDIRVLGATKINRQEMRGDTKEYLSVMRHMTKNLW